ncbi:15952_t:CDS:1, partial [Gigaspora margarita]
DIFDSKSENKSEPEKKNNISKNRIFSFKKVSKISDQGLYINYLAIILETYSYQEDPLVTFENIENQI